MLTLYRSFLAEFTALTSLLSSGHHSTPRFVPGGNERNALKEGATAFFDRLAELESLLKQYPLSRSEPDMRDRVGKEAGDVVRDGYRAFVRRCEEKGLEKCESSIMQHHATSYFLTLAGS